MNYPKSKQILEKIKKAKKILLNCHRNPDPDSVGSALSLYQVLKKMGKEVEIVCPTEVADLMKFLPYFELVKTVDFSVFDFSKFDLFIVLDSSSWNMVLNSKELPAPKIPLIVIDHHKTNSSYGEINLVDNKMTSTGEILYLVFEDWQVEIDKDIATALLAAIIGDTGAFRYPGVTKRTLEIAGELMAKGADKDDIIFHLYRSIDFDLIKFWGEVLSTTQIDKQGKFIWSAISYNRFEELGGPEMGRELAAGLFFQIVAGTEFGIFMVEQEKEKLIISFRSRTGFDTSKIATALGGGGHIYASGANVENLSFDKAVEKVLQTARKYAKQNLKKN